MTAKLPYHLDTDSEGLVNGLTLSEMALSILLENQVDIMLFLAERPNNKPSKEFLTMLAYETEEWLNRNMRITKCNPPDPNAAPTASHSPPSDPSA